MEGKRHSPHGCSLHPSPGQARIFLEVFGTGMGHGTLGVLELNWEGLDFTWNRSIWNHWELPQLEVTNCKWDL